MKNQATKKLTKKAAREQVDKALFSLIDLENSLGRKKFKRRLKKVERILLEGLPKAKKEKKQVVEDVIGEQNETLDENKLTAADFV